MGVLYLAALTVSITGMAVLDRRFGLFFARDARRAAVVLAAGVATFLVWDLGGIALGVFFRGQTPYMTGLLLAPELPVEEVFFLVLLCYLTMNVWAGAGMVLGARDDAGRGGRSTEAGGTGGPTGAADGGAATGGAADGGRRTAGGPQ